VDRLVTDAEAMRQYYLATFARGSDMIAYGAELRSSVAPQLIASLGLAPRQYNLVVSRLIPENSLEAILEGYARSRSTRKLVVVGGATYRSAFHQRLTELAAADPRVQLVGQLADQALLDELWCKFYAYLHGHSVGGTNPALLRAMGCRSAVIARDTEFNREVLDDSGIYFSPTAESVAGAIDRLEADEACTERLRGLAQERVSRLYTWERITQQYEECFTRAAAGART
jgi:glycosyltransferase involved in cell wall biosynthesis